MNREELISLVKQYSNETAGLSFTKRNHPAYVAILNAGEEVIPWLLERLQDSIGHDSGKDMDFDNDPWMVISLIRELSDGKSSEGMPQGYAGRLEKVREWVLRWGEKSE